MGSAKTGSAIDVRIDDAGISVSAFLFDSLPMVSQLSPIGFGGIGGRY